MVFRHGSQQMVFRHGSQQTVFWHGLQHTVLVFTTEQHPRLEGIPRKVTPMLKKLMDLVMDDMYQAEEMFGIRKYQFLKLCRDVTWTKS
ncbi:hypothetical protein llap_13582 [Limosa lapponica baueri]|uniref:Uncharacterized protein n=1 Tax=Limosa lapponica baueri TaxID=1758121 RepID=A0A2I0TQQ0_LIMLA|nr:hypothetical protein llap_13582 [Limosa lapponica baueri]